MPGFARHRQDGGEFYQVDVSPAIESYGGSIPVYIAAAFMGVTQSAIPISLEVLRDTKERLPFADGYSQIVTASSGSFTTQILERASGRAELGREVQDLIGDGWLKKLDAYADVDFYKGQLKRMALDDE